MTIDEILTLAVKKGASDVHIKAGIVPVVRKHGMLRPLAAGLPQLSSENIEQMAATMMDDEAKKHFREFNEVDLGYGVRGLGRFRVNIFMQRGSMRMVIRTIPFKVPQLEELQLPSVVQKISDLERGLVLVTGVTGSGKSTTLAAMIDHINRTKNKHILTIEDPIEYLIRDRKSLVSQRELGVDTYSFTGALRAALRQDPDIILIGEMRDKETIDIALVAAETGHLVLSTLHTLDATESINRILSCYEPYQQLQIRRQLASVLKATISQRLCRKADKKGFVPAVEVLINNPRIKELIEDETRTKEIKSAIEQGRGNNMQSFDQSLMVLVSKKLITFEEGMKQAANPEDFQLRFQGIASGGDHFSQHDKVGEMDMQKSWDNLEKLEIDPSSKEKNRKDIDPSLKIQKNQDYGGMDDDSEDAS